MTSEARPAILRTERLLLRPFLEGDADDVYAYARLEEWSRYHLPVVPYPYTREDADTFIAATIATPWSDAAHWAIVLDERVIGGVSLKNEPSAPRAELGYSLAPAHWNRGLTTEAARAALDYAFFVLAVDEVDARADARNIGSWRVMEKLGMHRTSLTEGGRIDRTGAAVDEVHYAISRDAWLR